MTAVAAADDATLAGFAAEVGDEGPVAVAGHRTRWQLGGPSPPGVRLVTAPSGIVEHRPEEMTVRVRAGTPSADLAAELAVKGQRTALPERGGTVGGAVAVGENHLGVAGRGRLRHAVLEARYISAEGCVITGGGPTVKNVSGFDLPRLLVGSLGTLGLIAEVILRTNPVPEASVWLVADDADPFAVFNALSVATAVLWDGRRTWAQLEGHPSDVEADAARLGRLGAFDEASSPPDLPGHRWSLRPSELRTLDGDETGAFVALIGVGTVLATKPQPRRHPAPAVTAVSARIKSSFDPRGRLNPGRDPVRR